MKRTQAGVSLIEVLMFTVIVGVGIAGLMGVYRVAVVGSADPLVRKQALALAESLLTEIEQQPFTYCYPEDPNYSDDEAGADAAAGTCGNTAYSEDRGGGAFGPFEPDVQSRYSQTHPFNNVADYGGFSWSPITSIDQPQTAIPELAGYSATVSISRVGTTPFGLSPDGAALRIVVRVTRAPVEVTLVGYRFRYAP